MTDDNRILILYGTQTCTAKEIAESIWRTIKIFGLKGPVLGMDEYDISNFIKEEFAIFVCATTGQGDEPDNMRKFWRFLLRKNLPTNSLMRLKFGVIGLGDSSYSKFNFVGKKLHKRLIQLGATPLIDVGLCDYQHDLGHDAVLIPWLKDFYSKLKLHFPSIQIENFKNYFVPKWKVSLLSLVPEYTKNNFNEDIYFSKGIKNSLFNATCFEVDKNVRTTKETHFQDVRLITLKTMNHTVLKYKPGDVFNIRPRNSKEDIDELFQIFNDNKMNIKPYYRLLVEEQHEDMPVPEFLKQTLSLYEIAEQYWDLKCYPSQYVFSLLALVSDDKLERDKCIELSSPEGQEEWLNYSRRPKRTVLEVLRDFHKSTSKLTIEILFEFFSPIKPRSFSIASSCLPSQGTSLDLLVAVVKYRTILKKDRLGLCSNWLSGLKLGDRIHGWIKNGTIQFPTDTNIPNILISPGTGLAPFRSFLQERVFEESATKETLYLFFGCRYADKDFHCGDELKRMVDDGKLTLFTAFSRDQENKIYVQHKIAEQGVLLWKLINEQKACVFISGNAKNMPDNVRDSLVEEVFSKIGGLGLEEAKSFLNKMENNGRLQVEAW